MRRILPETNANSRVGADLGRIVLTPNGFRCISPRQRNRRDRARMLLRGEAMLSEVSSSLLRNQVWID